MERDELPIEARVRALELGAELMAQSTTEAIHRLDKELAATDERLCESWADQGKRIDALEDRRNEHFVEHTARIVAGPPDAAERDRQARWHATYNAFVQNRIIYRERKEGDELFDATGNVPNLAYTDHWASKFADYAHGPLEAKADELSIAEAGARAFDRSMADKVNALVKAARDLADEYDHRLSHVAAVYEALKPFEGVS